MGNPEYEREIIKTDDGYSEKKIDINLETGIFKKGNQKVVFQKKRKK